MPFGLIQKNNTPKTVACVIFYFIVNLARREKQQLFFFIRNKVERKSMFFVFFMVFSFRFNPVVIAGKESICLQRSVVYLR